MTAPPPRSVGYGASVVTLSQLVTVAAAGITAIVVARMFGPSGTGAYGLVQTALALIVLFASLGIENGVLYHVGGGRWPAAAALQQIMWAAIVLGLAGAGIGVLIGLLTADSLFDGVGGDVVTIGMLATPFMLAWTYTSFLALATGDYGAYLRGPALQAVLCLLLTPVAAAVWDVEGAIAALTASNVFAAWLLHRRLRSGFGPAPPGTAERAGRDLRAAARFGIPAQVTNGLGTLTYRADLFVLNAVTTVASVGQYAIAVSITSLGWIAPRSVSAVVMPRVASLEGEEGGIDQTDLIAKAVRHSVILAAATTVALALGVQLIPLVYGEDFRPAVTLSLLLLPGIAALGVGNVLASSILGKGKPVCNLIAAAIVAPIAIALYLVVIPAHGAKGAAVASSISYCLTTLLFLFFFRRVTGISDIRLLIPRREDFADYRALAKAALSRLRRRNRASS